eukprot:2872067-Amphidinium_carterae.1
MQIVQNKSLLHCLCQNRLPEVSRFESTMARDEPKWKQQKSATWLIMQEIRPTKFLQCNLSSLFSAMPCTRRLSASFNHWWSCIWIWEHTHVG